MPLQASKTTLTLGIGAVLCAGALLTLEAQQGAPGGRGGGRGGSGAGMFTILDADKDGAVTREELKAGFAKWLADGDTGRGGSVTQDQLGTVLNAALPQPTPPAAALSAVLSCKQCGAGIEPSDRFCGDCGAAVSI